MCLSYSEIRSVEVRTRKRRRCGWCSEAINAGDKAQSRAYVFGGDFNSDYMHPECFNAMNDSPNEEICEGWMPGDFERGIAA